MAGTINKGKLFQTAVLAYMGELMESPLKKYCEKQTATGGESITFNRIKASSASDGIQSMYNGDGQQNGGDMVPIEVPISQISAQHKIPDSDMKKTKIDVKNVYVRSLSNATKVKEVGKIVAAIGALAAKAKPTGDTMMTQCKGVQIAGVTSAADVKKIIAQIRKAKALAKMTPDGHTGVALVISSDDWAEISTSEYVLNADYGAVFGGGTNGEPTTFYGAEVCIVDGDAKVGGENNVMYLVPSNTICFAEWENSIDVTAELHKTDGMKWHLQIVKSVGVKVAEGHHIIKITKEVIS